MDQVPLSMNMKATYRTLRWGTAILGLALPWVLWIGGHALGGLALQGSMSAYYHTVMRDEFVGFLFAVSGMLVVYRGYTWLENWALNVGGLFLAGVALFPMELSCDGPCPAISLHGSFAVLFFLSIAYVCIFRAADTLGLMKDKTKERRYRRVYRSLGGTMIASPLIAVILAYILQPHSQVPSVIFFVEAAGVYVFAVYWIVKGRELKATDAETLAAKGKLSLPPHGARDLFRPILVEQVP